MEWKVFKDMCCSFLCSNEYGTSTSPSWGGADAFLGISPARTISRTFCSTSHPGLSICFLVSGQPSRILTISHAGYSSICVQVILICVHNSFCFTSSHGLSFHVTSRHFMSHCASGNIVISCPFIRTLTNLSKESYAETICYFILNTLFCTVCLVHHPPAIRFAWQMCCITLQEPCQTASIKV